MKPIKQVLRRILSYQEQMHIGIHQDSLMDGSGECGSYIYRGWHNWYGRKLTKILADTGVTLGELQEAAVAYANKELELGPKEVTICWSPGHCTTKPKDITDTYYASFLFINENDDITDSDSWSYRHS